MGDQRHERLWRLVTERLPDQRAGTGWAGVVCAVAVERLGVDAAAVTVRTTVRTQQLVAATDAWAEELEELQYTLGEGPGVAAFTSGEPVLVGDMGTGRHQWPGFEGEAASAGVGAAFAFPLQAGTTWLGTLDLYRRTPATLDAEHLADAVALAALTTTALLADAGGDEVAPWARADLPGHYDEVNIATGMLAGRLDISLDDAMLRLRAHAFSHHLPLTEVAQAVLQHRIRPDTFAE
ncbi:GAF and ANTAR domain-containing protein [Actinophytocola algeriensis]|uniref:ANTAR domain-containing protein n=1 Tax=Actinophytocola algeriensis TaxID=1768010 RepID=A0A7W7Q7H5_9PSEU|nr:GAF and ANTAR domain-containing protein [Actinophytocola algeriensis]MBB4908465.1 hypothetical protein [Actinophytocola algeriensis]MBE1475148.1 hypothetical protein [Actinophytocola algeriensis]